MKSLSFSRSFGETVELASLLSASIEMKRRSSPCSFESSSSSSSLGLSQKREREGEREPPGRRSSDRRMKTC